MSACGPSPAASATAPWARSPACWPPARQWRATTPAGATPPLQVKLGLVVVVAGLVVRHMRRPALHALEGLIFVGSRPSSGWAWPWLISLWGAWPSSSLPHSSTEKAARAVAMRAGPSAVALATSAYWLVAVLAVGFWLRVLPAPQSPRTARPTPRLSPASVGPGEAPGAPKLFARGNGGVLDPPGGGVGVRLRGGWPPRRVLPLLDLGPGVRVLFGLWVGCLVFGVVLGVGLVAGPCERTEPSFRLARAARGPGAGPARGPAGILPVPRTSPRTRTGAPPTWP